MVVLQDVRYLNQSMTNTYCYNMKSLNKVESNYCSSYAINSSVHLFFHQLIIWYVFFNLIRRDKIHTVAIHKVGENIASTEPKVLMTDDVSETNELANRFQINRRKGDNELYVTNSFSVKAGRYYDKYLNLEKQSFFSNFTYTIIQPVLIAIFSGFILGFIPLIKDWWFNPKSSVTVIFIFDLALCRHSNFNR